MIIKREISNKTDFPEGFYPGTVERIEIKNEQSRFSETGERTVLKIFLKIFIPSGHVTLMTPVTAILSPKSRLTKLLEDMELLPRATEDFDTNTLIGLDVTVLVEKVVKNGVRYTNVSKMKRRTEQIAV